MPGNTLTAFTPELWSKMGVDILRETIVMPRLVRTDFSTDLAQAGDTVNTRKPATMVANTVNTVTGVTVQDVSATNIPVTLTNHEDATFKISDREATRSFANLVTEFLDPAMLAIANSVDTAILGLYTDITEDITAASAATWRTKFNDARTLLNKHKAPNTMRVAVLSDDDEGDVSNNDLLIKANESGGTTTLREGSVGRFRGFDVYRSSNVTNVGSPGVRKNLFFHRNAFALVVRPLTTATGSAPGALQTVSNDKDAGLSLRVTISYNATLLSTQVTCDILYGVKTLDEQLAVLCNASY